MLISRRYFIISIYLITTAASAETLRIHVVDKEAKNVPDTVVFAQSSQPSAKDNAPKNKIVIDQIDKEFIHPITVIRPGTAVIFPNHDKIRHHVYSFSPAKTFELPLYKDDTPKPILFDKPGVVALGCNIHDWMTAYIYVVDSPFAALTDANGSARLTLPAGRYTVQIWHPRLKNPDENHADTVTVHTGSTAMLEIAVELKKSFRPIRTPADGFAYEAYH